MRARDFIREVNAPGELAVDYDLIDRFTGAGWQVLGEGQDQIVLAKPGSNTVLKIVGSGSLPRQAEIRRYVEFFRANQRNPHYPRVGPDRELDWKGKKYYAYTQERLQALPGDEAVLDYLENFIGRYDRDPAVVERDIPPGLTYEQVDGLTLALDRMFDAGFSGSGYDLGNVANIMQRENGQLVIVDPFSSLDDELSENKLAEASSGYREIEFVCVNPEFPDATDPDQQQRLARALKQIPGVITLMQDWSDHSPGQCSLTAIYRGARTARRIRKVAQDMGVAIDLEQPVSDAYVDRAIRGEHEGQQEVKEVKILSKIKGKGAEPSQLPRYGRPIEPGREEFYLGRKVGSFQGYDIYRDWLGGQLSYHLFDPRSRIAILTSFGSQYKGNPDSYIIHGLYAAPGNPVKAHQFYRALIQDLGITLISDRKQSPGGNKVWQRLEAYPDVNVYGFDTKTGDLLNFGARDSEMYAIPAQAATNPENKYIANNIRLVATAKKK